MSKRLLTALALLLLSLNSPVFATELPPSSETMVADLINLGYQCKAQKSGEEAYITVTHEQDEFWDFVVIPSGKGLIFSLNFKLKPESLKDRLKLFEEINATNADKVKMTQVFIYKHRNGNEYLMVNAWTPDAYDKAAFAAFVLQWQEDSHNAALSLRDHFEARPVKPQPTP
jgi:hypothetical protein